jgi:hypothetical protein
MDLFVEVSQSKLSLKLSRYDNVLLKGNLSKLNSKLSRWHMDLLVESRNLFKLSLITHMPFASR